MTKINFDQLINELALNLPTEVEHDVMGGKRTVIAKYITIRAGFLHRAYELANTAYNCSLENNIVSAKTLTRALFETITVLGYLYYKIEAFNQDKNIIDFNKTLMNILLGSRFKDSEFTQINILTMVQLIDKKIPDYEENYGLLCEYSHPNFAGTCGFYGEPENEKPTMFTGLPKDVVIHQQATIESICLCLDTLKYFILETNEIFEQFIKIVKEYEETE